jgi:hypothetical protein
MVPLHAPGSHDVSQSASSKMPKVDQINSGQFLTLHVG